MRVLLMAFLAFSTTTAFTSEPLLGMRFSDCDTESKYSDLDYSVEYMRSNEEFEAEIFRKKDSRNCKGKAQFAIGRIWKYEVNGNELITTLERVKVIITNQDLIDPFNRNGICGVSNWKINEFISCEGKNVLGLEGIPGYRTIHQFKLKGKELHLTEENGDKFKLILDN